MFIGAYWGAREESRQSVAARLVAFLLALRGADPSDLGQWFVRGAGQVPATAALDLDEASISRCLTTSRADIGDEPLPELGFGLSAVGGETEGVSLRAHVGAYSTLVPNAVVLTVDRPLDAAIYQRVLQAAVAAFDPDHAVVTTDDMLDAANARNPWDAGLITYARESGYRGA